MHTLQVLILAVQFMLFIVCSFGNVYCIPTISGLSQKLQTSKIVAILFFQALYEQQKKSQLCDLSLVVENVSFPAHKCVLAAYSGYFCALFDQGKQSDNAGSKVGCK